VHVIRMACDLLARELAFLGSELIEETMKALFFLECVFIYRMCT
jgi:hypothetical protein